MKKKFSIFMLIAVIGGGITNIKTYNTNPYPKIAGNFWETCNNCTLKNNILSCTCKTRNQQANSTSISVNKNSYLENINGTLYDPYQNKYNQNRLNSSKKVSLDSLNAQYQQIEQRIKSLSQSKISSLNSQQLLTLINSITQQINSIEQQLIPLEKHMRADEKNHNWSEMSNLRQQGEKLWQEKQQLQQQLENLLQALTPQQKEELRQPISTQIKNLQNKLQPLLNKIT